MRTAVKRAARILSSSSSIVVAVALAAWLVLGGASPAQAQEPGTLRLAIPGDEGSLTPYTYVTGYPGYELMSLVFDTLLRMDLDLRPRPWLATSVEIEPGEDDVVRYRVRLRDDVRWHDGERFDADDVAFSFDYYRTHVMSRFTSAAERVARLDVVGPYELRLELDAPDATFHEAVLADLPMLPEHVYRGIDDPRSVREAVGTGPYLLTQIEAERFYRFDANPAFWGAEPTLTTIVVPIIRDETTTFQALRAGEIDAAARALPPASVAAFEVAPNLEVARGSNFATTLLLMDVTRPGLSDPAVRRAIVGAIDTRRLVEVLLLGAGTVGAPGFLHPATPFANADTAEPAPLDRDAVQTELEEAGYALGRDGVYVGADGARLGFELLAPSNNPTRLRAAELIAQDLAAVGIDADVRSMEFDALTEKAWPGFDVSRGRDYELAVFGWSAPINARANLLGLLHGDPSLGTLNLSGFADPEVDALTVAATRATDPGERAELLARVQEIVARDVPFVTLFYPEGAYAYRPEAYDGWVYMAGQGILNVHSFLAR